MGNSTSRRRATAERHLRIKTKAVGVDLRGHPPRFVADVMLGRLAKWLRIAGFDVLYSNRYSDDELVELSRGQGRILLSRDTRLLIRRSVDRFVYLESDRVQEQVQQVLRLTGTPAPESLFSRCLACNEPLAQVPREVVHGQVPPYVYETQALFKSCRRCRRIFWAGTHRPAVIRVLENLVERDGGPA
jgi:hypothetical protein